MPFAKDSLSKNAAGGTEIMKFGVENRLGNLLDDFQIFVSRVEEPIDDEKYVILWCHDLADDPAVAHLKNDGWKKFDHFIFTSHWQQFHYNIMLGVPYSRGTVIPNAIEPIEAHQKPTDKINFIYFSTPHRGLELLYPVFDNLASRHDDIHLHVFSSFNIYGWPERDKPYVDLFEKIKTHDNMTYHGSVLNSEIREALKNSHFFLYPNIWPETFCISLVEAMSAGCIAIHPGYGALPEVACGVSNVYQWKEEPIDHANEALGITEAILNEYKGDKTAFEYNTKFSKKLIDAKYNWNECVARWKVLINNLKSRPPVKQKQNKQMFVVRTHNV